MTDKGSLLDQMAAQMGCVCLSDLRFLDARRREYLVRRLHPLSPHTWALKEWNDALIYLTGLPPQPTVQQAKEQMIQFLGAQPGEEAETVP